ncbi:DNA replication initiation ATPase (modular protein) [Candidatus Filomicrobium marinum]|uniref:DNA replication initiation ATPase (Modular protein) n=1 Tax=Candidatus Filomicrobium marinum TaxID=1608628 RepID=A0A0D6JK82_9HYPH|nr:DUF6456 domain-containing protein [Candidatus Filomicrobium marinum]CFX30929.1 DNA replication initiation ATPase (modular protein) [Candidatus Filomicrobium marinum]CPR22055.1 DNA replication initiation ATPase (modular protein) [Candidatus Filomicrobium marinum]
MAENARELPRDASTRRALKKLSLRTALAEETDDGGVTILAERDGQDGLTACGEIQPDLWANFVRRGWVVRETEGRWRLANAGRIHLKRLMSRGEGLSDLTAASHPPKTSGGGRARPEMNLAESPLAWLRRRTDRHGQPLISQAQFEAGERLRADFERGSMGARVTANWSSTGGVTPGSVGPDREIALRGHALAARERVRAALSATGPELSGILVDVCCHLKGLADVERGAGWPQRTAKVVLLLALTTLARHYGMIGQADGHMGGDRIRHWGAADFRPEGDVAG